MRLELMTAPAVAEHIVKKPAVIVPVGATEQHGPDGLIGTDHLCAELIARRCGREHAILVAPTLAYGMSQFHLAFTGSVTLRPSTLAAMAHDVVASLAATGFRRILFLNGHGGNLAPLRAGIQEYYAARSLGLVRDATPAQCRVRSWWEMPAVDALRKGLYGAGEGYHATPSELAITMAGYPEAIVPFERPPPPVPERDPIVHAGDNYYDAADYRRRFPDGRVISHSALARPADGERLIVAAVADLAAEVDGFLAAD